MALLFDTPQLMSFLTPIWACLFVLINKEQPKRKQKQRQKQHIEKHFFSCFLTFMLSEMSHGWTVCIHSLAGCGFVRRYSEILIRGLLYKWIRCLSGSKVRKPKAFFHCLTHMIKWMTRWTGSKFKFPKWSSYQYSTVLQYTARCTVDTVEYW